MFYYLALRLMNRELWVLIIAISILPKNKYQMKILIFYVGYLSGISSKGYRKPDRELTTSFDVINENRALSEAAINQELNLDLFQGDIIRYTQPSSRNIQKDFTKRWPKWVYDLTYKKHNSFFWLWKNLLAGRYISKLNLKYLQMWWVFYSKQLKKSKSELQYDSKCWQTKKMAF